MSVLIKNMKMPSGCGLCRFDDYGYCTMTKKYSGGSATHGIASFCPLVELSGKHGDLIDRNALKKDYKMSNDCKRCETDWKSCQYDRVYSKMDFCEWLDDAPVVIEAEGEE